MAKPALTITNAATFIILLWVEFYHQKDVLKSYFQ